ncbi:MAG: hypothetical protein H6597_05440 [Flavobacteriales bacterium]|nr:hypothetical protein [Flavobacteriales bacterium]MCB9193959.1 hypothetical protein [Flavobacteriales bacterium]
MRPHLFVLAFMLVSVAHSQTCTDVEGHVYPTVVIGAQRWMAANLRTTTYNNGEPIPSGLLNTQWQSTASGACAVQDNNAANDTIYGRLYNGYAMHDVRGLCPQGWHIPTDAEWRTLEVALGMSLAESTFTGWRGANENIGGMLKDTLLWTSPGSNTNSSGFSALPGGVRTLQGLFSPLGTSAYFWTSTSTASSTGYARGLADYQTGVVRDPVTYQSGYSCRCMDDELVGVEEHTPLPGTLVLMPDPADTHLLMRLSGTRAVRSTITDALGRIVADGSWRDDGMDVSTLGSGIYVVRAYDGSGRMVASGRFMKR